MSTIRLAKPVDVSVGISVDAPSLDSLQGCSGLLSIADLSAEQIAAVIDLARDIKAAPATYRRALDGLSIVMLFEKPSLRTRMSFEIGLTKLGAHVVYFDHAAQRIGERESVKDYAKNIERWTDAVVARVFDHAVLEQLAEHASIPVVNALSDIEHPCQALADVMTLTERFGTVAGLRLAWIGDGNNVCHSLVLAVAKLGAHITIITPEAREPSAAIVASAKHAAAAAGGSVSLSTDPNAIKGHDAVYTDTWVSMGDEPADTASRLEVFTPYAVDAKAMRLAGTGRKAPAVFMHCLPAHRGEEVTDDVIDAPTSLVYDQAENRMHAQNAVMLALLGRLPAERQ